MSKTKYFHLYANGVDSNGKNHVVTVVGKLEQTYFKKPIKTKVPVEVKPHVFINGELTYSKKTLKRVLTVGVSICNPTDKFDEEEGIRVAKKRIEEGKDAGKIETNDVTMLTEDLILAELLGKLTYITDNIDKYLPQEKEENDVSPKEFDPDCDSIG